MMTWEEQNAENNSHDATRPPVTSAEDQNDHCAFLLPDTPTTKIYSTDDVEIAVEDLDDDEISEPPMKNEEVLQGRQRREVHRLAILVFCLCVSILAITLGVVLGTKDRNDVTLEEVGNGNSDALVIVSNDQCKTSAKSAAADGSEEVGQITFADKSTFSNIMGVCGTAAYGGGSIGKWYAFAGTGSTVLVTACSKGCAVPDGAMMSPTISVFQGSSCDQMLCVDGMTNVAVEGPLQFHAVMGESYFVYVQSSGNHTGLYEIALAV